MFLDFDRCYRAVQSRDARFNGWFITAVTSTGIYCRPSCPALTPKAANVRFYPSAAAAQLGGFRACKRCRPDAAPGSPEWNVRADLVARAMRHIADGVVDREGVAGLASRLGYSERHLNRQLVAELGAGPLALARAQRAQTARTLIETTDLAFAHVAFAAGFASIRQFNDTVKEVFAVTPSQLRHGSRRLGRPAPETGSLELRLSFRTPMHVDALIGFLGARAVVGVEEVTAASYRRTLRLAHGAGTVELTPHIDHMGCRLRLEDLRDLTSAVQRCRRLLDLDADPVAVDAHLGGDPVLAPLVAAGRGRRVPGTVDGHELAIRAVLGQQVSIAGARTLTRRLVERYGKPLTAPDGGLSHLFPDADTLAGAELAHLGLPGARARALTSLAGALAAGEIDLEPGADRTVVGTRLLLSPGVGPWTAAYIAMRALGDPDAFLASDLGVRRALEWRGQPGDRRSVATLAERWRPWRSYALQYLWGSPTPATAQARPGRRAPNPLDKLNREAP